MSIIQSAVARVNPNATDPSLPGYGPRVLEDTSNNMVLFMTMYLFARPIDVVADTLGRMARHKFALYGKR